MVAEHNFQKKELTIHYFKVHYYRQRILLYFDKALLLDNSKFTKMFMVTRLLKNDFEVFK